MGVDQKTMGVLKLYLHDYPIEDGRWFLFDKWGVQQQSWAAREGKRGYVYRYRENDLVRAVIVNYFDPPEPLPPGAKKKREAMEEEDEGEKPAARVFLPYLNVVTWYPEAQDMVNRSLRETYHFFHPGGDGRFISGLYRAGLSHWTGEERPLRTSSDGLDAFVLGRLKEIKDGKVKAAIASVHESAPPAGEDVLMAALEAMFESTAHIQPYWKTVDIYEMPGRFHHSLFAEKK